MFKSIFLASFNQILFLVVPLSAMLIVLRIPIVRLVFGASTLFDWESTVLTGKTVAYFSLSLFAQSLVHLLARSFYALHDTKIPLLSGAVAVISNTIFSIIFVIIFRWPVWSLGLSASLGSIINLLLLIYFLYIKIGPFSAVELFLPSLKIFLAAIVSAIALYLPLKLLDQLVFDTTRTFNLLILTGFSVILGLFVYIFFAWFMDVKEIAVIYKLISRLRKAKPPVSIVTTPDLTNIPENSV